MKKDILKKIDTLLETKEAIPIEKLEELIQEMMQFFQEASELLNKGAGDEKKDVMILMSEVQGKFRELGALVAKQMGLKPDQIQKMLNPKEFLPEEWKNIEKLKKEMEDKD